MQKLVMERKDMFSSGFVKLYTTGKLPQTVGDSLHRNRAWFELAFVRVGKSKRIYAISAVKQVQRQGEWMTEEFHGFAHLKQLPLPDDFAYQSGFTAKQLEDKPSERQLLARFRRFLRDVDVIYTYHTEHLQLLDYRFERMAVVPYLGQRGSIQPMIENVFPKLSGLNRKAICHALGIDCPQQAKPEDLAFENMQLFHSAICFASQLDVPLSSHPTP